MEKEEIGNKDQNNTEEVIKDKSEIKNSEEKIWNKFSKYLKTDRMNKMLEVAKARTKYIRLVVQDLQNEHNISACIRSAEAFGIQEVDIVRTYSSINHLNVSKGCSDWLTINEYSDVKTCTTYLKKGFHVFTRGRPCMIRYTSPRIGRVKGFPRTPPTPHPPSPSPGAGHPSSHAAVAPENSSRARTQQLYSESYKNPLA